MNKKKTGGELKRALLCMEKRFYFYLPKIAIEFQNGGYVIIEAPVKPKVTIYLYQLADDFYPHFAG